MLHIYICVGSSCHMKGSYQIIKIFESEIKKRNLENRVELKASFCLERCTKGVAVKVDQEYIEELTIANATEKFQEYIVSRLTL